MKEIIVQKNDAGQRLDKFLGKAFPDLARSMMYKGLRNKKIKVNRKRATYDQKLNEGDVILLFLPEDALFTRTRAISGNPDVDVIFEDQNLLIVNKPAGLLSQKDTAADQDTLNDRVQAYLYHKGEYDPQKELSFVPAICHRLDRNTSGLVIAAKTAEAARLVNEAIADHKLKKEYLAVTQGIPEEKRVEVFLKKEGTRAEISSREKEGYVPAVLTTKVLKSDPAATGNRKALVHVDLETGRFHQIRATLAAMGTPLAGDVKYGGSAKDGPYKLQAYRLTLQDIDLPGLPDVVELPVSKQLNFGK